MKRFVDLHIVNPSNVEDVFRFLSLLGYGMVGLTLNQKPEKIWENWKKLGEKFGVDVVSRINLKPSSTHELLGWLGNLRRKFELIAVTCESKPVLNVAARDHRVDLLNLTPLNLRLFDEAAAGLASNSNVALEISLNPIVKMERKMFPRIFFYVRRCLNLTKKYGIPIVVSSGASNILEIKPPRDLAAFIQIFGLDKEIALKTVSEIPKKIVEKNRKKLSKDFVGVGVRIVKIGG